MNKAIKGWKYFIRKKFSIKFDCFKLKFDFRATKSMAAKSYRNRSKEKNEISN